jgi:hypothetical protein
LGTGTIGGEIVDIENETIIQVAAGALTSYAVTLSGQVYQWYKFFLSIYQIAS